MNAVADCAEIFDADTARLRAGLERNLFLDSLILDYNAVLRIRRQLKEREYIRVPSQNRSAAHGNGIFLRCVIGVVILQLHAYGTASQIKDLYHNKTS
jgi:hypothetical protein